MIDAKNCASSCGISPTVPLADVEKAASWLVGKFETSAEKVVRGTRVIASKLIVGTGYAGEGVGKGIEAFRREAELLSRRVEQHLQKA